MTENPKLEKMGFNSLSSNCEAQELDEKVGQKISASDHHVNGVQHSDSFVVDMESFSQIIEKDINVNSRITLQRNFSRKGSTRGGDKKISTTSTATSMLAAATLYDGGTPEKPLVAARGATDHSVSPKHHHQITIKNSGLGSPAADSKRAGNRFGFRHSPLAWSIDPRKILMLFATLSSIGTILLIYFTLSMGKLNGDDNDLNS